MALLYDRKTALTVQEVTTQGVGKNQTTTTNPLYIPGFDPMAPLRVQFEIQKTIEPEPNIATIQVWNLNEEHRGAVEKDYLITFRAGYASDVIDSGNILDLPIVFRGNLTRVFQTKELVGWKTTFVSGDGSNAHKKAMFNDLVPSGTSVGEVFDRIKDKLQAYGVEVQSDFTGSILHWLTIQWKKSASGPNTEGTDNTGNPVLEAPKAIVGKLSDIITEETDKLNLDWSIQNNTMVIRPKGGADAQPAIVISPTTGLIGSPERDERGGVTGRTLIINGLEPGRKIELQSEVITGNYVVAKTRLTGDTEGQEYYIDFEAFVEGSEVEL